MGLQDSYIVPSALFSHLILFHHRPTADQNP